MCKLRYWSNCLIFIFVILIHTGHLFSADDTYTFIPSMPEMRLSDDGKTLYNAPALGVVVNDPNPNAERIHHPAPESLRNMSSAISTFQFAYLSAGQTDFLGQTCYTVPDATKTAFNYAGTLWGNLVKSSVPIKILVCWSSLDGEKLGYSGGGPSHRNFDNAPRADTWFAASLSNSLAEIDLEPSKYDMYITYNKNFNWYTGTDANPPSESYDMVTVALHEICHGLNFTGSITCTAQFAQWGYYGYPNIYDTFINGGSGDSILNTSVYPNNSYKLRDVVISNDLWFRGSQAIEANGTCVKIFAPINWIPGSSYVHLDNIVFASGKNRLMLYAIPSGTALHEPGPVTMAILKDLGWKTAGSTQAQ